MGPHSRVETLKPDAPEFDGPDEQRPGEHYEHKWVPDKEDPLVEERRAKQPDRPDKIMVYSAFPSNLPLIKKASHYFGWASSTSLTMRTGP